MRNIGRVQFTCSLIEIEITLLFRFIFLMKLKSHIFLWFGFWAAASLTWIIYIYSPDFFFYLVRRPILAGIQFVFGAWLLKINHFAWRIVIFVIAGIIIGQWWTILWGMAFLSWRINGFAP